MDEVLISIYWRKVLLDLLVCSYNTALSWGYIRGIMMGISVDNFVEKSVKKVDNFGDD
jgi:hypothetical protein